MLMMEEVKESCLSELEKSGSCIFGSGYVNAAMENITKAVNLSHILSKLVEVTGDCISYTNSLFQQWEAVLQDMNEKRCGISTYLFGFREESVDSVQEVISQICSQNNLERYRSVYRMDVAIGDMDETGEAYVKAVLYPVSLKEES